jgi:hypothetical protein
VKLGELKSHIRSMRDAPQVFVNYGEGRKFLVVVTKMSLMEQLDKMFEKQRNVETGLTFDSDGRMILEAMRAAARPAPEEIELDDDLVEIDLADIDIGVAGKDSGDDIELDEL